jgi:hypothetical protein
MRISKIISSFIAVAALAGCAHPIVISPDIGKIEADAASKPITKNVAYYIADDVRTKEVVTPGGGGDQVSYQPYRDIETAFYKMLTNVFGNVTRLKTPKDAEAISKNQVSYLITPHIVTNSSSPSTTASLAPQASSGAGSGGLFRIIFSCLPREPAIFVTL